MDPQPTPVAIEDIEVGDIVRQQHFDWRVQAVEDHGPTVANGPRCYWLFLERTDIGGFEKRLTYWQGEKLAFIRQARIYEIATRKVP